MATEPKTVHAWMPDGRSLCDRRAEPRKPKPDDAIAAVEVARDAPTCGACALLIHALRCDLAIKHSEGRSIWPATPAAAIRSMKGTRWDSFLNLDDWGSDMKPIDLVAELLRGLDPEQLAEVASRRRKAYSDRIAELSEDS